MRSVAISLLSTQMLISCVFSIFFSLLDSGLPFLIDLFNELKKGVIPFCYGFPDYAFLDLCSNFYYLFSSIDFRPKLISFPMVKAQMIVLVVSSPIHKFMIYVSFFLLQCYCCIKNFLVNFVFILIKFNMSLSFSGAFWFHPGINEKCFNFQTYMDYPSIFLLWTASLVLLWCENIPCMILIPLYW